jgi:hypothetical protein
MDRPACGHSNPDDARFCGACGTAVVAIEVCPSCGASFASGQRFCTACGTQLPVGEPEPATEASFDLSA